MAKKKQAVADKPAKKKWTEDQRKAQSATMRKMWAQKNQAKKQPVAQKKTVVQKIPELSFGKRVLLKIKNILMMFKP